MTSSRAIAVLALLLALGAGCRSVRMPEEPQGPHFRVLTYNVNWGGAEPDLAIDMIRRTNAEIVCLQETTPAWENHLRRALAREYPHMDFRSSIGRAGGGLGFLSKVKGAEVAYIPSDTGWFDGWIMQFGTAAGPVQVLNVHLRPPVSDRGGWVSGYLTTGDDREREMERFYARVRADAAVIVAGDFNEGENGGVLDWLGRKGMRNALPEFDRSTATWEWRTSMGTLRRRMDHIMYGPELYCYDARVIKGGASDHFPVIATFGTRADANVRNKVRAVTD
jgi:endonuclease/exonuclease/phosphatase (EEP) superfamily protein YafD